MGEIVYSITISDDLSEKKCSRLIDQFEGHFQENGFKVKSTKVKSGSTEIDFTLEFLKNSAVVVTVATIGIFIIKTFAGELIKDIYKKSKNQKHFDLNNHESVLEAVQEISNDPEILRKNVNYKLVREIFQNELKIIKEEGYEFKKLQIKFSSSYEKLDISFEDDSRMAKRSFKLNYDFIYK